MEKSKSDKKFCLEMALTRIRGKLDKEGGASLTERQATSAKTEVQTALDAYKRATTEYLIALHDDQDKRKQEMELFHRELDESEETLDRILEIVDNYEVAKNSPAPSQQEKQNLLAAFKSKQDLTMKSISNMLTQLNNLSKEDRVTSSTTAIKTQLKELGDLKREAEGKTNSLFDELFELELPEGEAQKLSQDITSASEAQCEEMNSLKLRLTEALSKLTKEGDGQAEAQGSDTTDLASHIVKGMSSCISELSSSLESNRGPSRTSTDFGFSKTSVPSFDGDIRKFPKWRSQVEDFIKDMSKRSSEKTAIHQLDRLTPEICDVSRCPTVLEAWKKLEAKFGSSTNIARLILQDFDSLSLKSKTEEAKLIELRDSLEKLESDLTINKQQQRCEDLHTVDKAESYLPPRYRIRYVERKEAMLIEKGSGFKALLAFLQEQGSLIEQYMPDKLDPLSKNEPKTHTEDKKDEKIKSLQARLNALEGRPGGEGAEKRDKLEKNLKKAEEKIGKCPACDSFHYFTGSRGHKVVSDKLWACEKFSGLSLEQRVDLVIKKKACASCLSWKHERSACEKPRTCSESGCKGNHNKLLHGSTNAKVFALTGGEGEGGLEVGMLEMFHHVFEDVNIGTTVLTDGGSNISLMTTELASYLHLRGVRKWMSIYRACESFPETEMRTVYTVTFTTTEGENHEVQCVEVDFITENCPPPDEAEVRKLFPHLPEGALSRPNLKVGILLGQNAAALLPRGGQGRDRVGNLRLMNIPLGKGYVLGGHHPRIQPSSSRAGTSHVRVMKISASTLNQAFPDLIELPIQLARTCTRCVGCKQCRFEVQNISLKEQRELQALRESVKLNPDEQICEASYPDLDPNLPYKDNRWQAVAMASSLEKQLLKNDMVEKYNGEWQGLVDRGTIKKVSQEEIASWKAKGGNISYISHHPVISPDKATSKCRLVANSSLKNCGNGPSPNENWPKGPNALKPMHRVFLRFRMYPVAVHFDLTKMFHSVKTGEKEQFMRMMVWRTCGKEWEDFGWQKVAFGDRPASCVLEICKDLAAEAGEHIDPEAARAIREDTYVDDGATGGSEETARRMIGEVKEEDDGTLKYTGTLAQIFKKAGFSLKMIVRSGETCSKAKDLMGGTVLGHPWEPVSDILSFKPKLFLGKKGKAGTHTGPMLTPKNMQENWSFPWTKSMVLSTIASIFDPSGIVCPYTLNLKLFMRELCLQEKIGWDEPLPDSLMKRWRTLIEELLLAPEILTKRGVKPANASGPPFLVIFSDGSSVAFGAVIYICYPLEDLSPGPWMQQLGKKSSFSSSLIIAKARVAPLAGITTPRSEMNGLMVGTILLDLLLESMLEKPSSVTFCLDSECTITAVDSKNGVLKCYLANRRATFLAALQDWRTKLPDTQFEELQHIAGPLNPADLATRPGCSAEDLGIDSLWQNGPKFLRQPREEWPVSREFCSKLPTEEVNKDAMLPHQTLGGGCINLFQAALGKDSISCQCRTCSLLLRKPGEGHQSLLDILSRTRRLLKARGVVARVLRCSAMLAKAGLAASTFTETELKAHLRTPLTAEDYDKADRVMLLLTQPETRKMLDAKPTGKTRSKNPNKGVRTIPVEYLGREIPGTQRTTNLSSLSPFQENGIWFTKGRYGKELTRVIGTPQLAILPPTSQMSYLIMFQAHSEAHMGGSDTCARSRPHAFIVRARPLADRVAADCLMCRKRLACPLSQRLGFLAEERTLIFSPPFTATALDFLGPFEVGAMNNKRSLLKVWPVVFVCMNTGGLHIELAHTYGTDALLLCIGAFASLRGYPATIYTDRGSQLCKAAQFASHKEDPQNWGWDAVEERLAAKKTKFKFCLPGCQWQNGGAEQRVRGLKESLMMIMLQGSNKLNFAEFRALLLSCANQINDRPLGVKQGESEILPLTPNQLLIGKTSSGSLSMELLDTGRDKFTRRAAYVAELSRIWWNNWFATCFDSLLPFRTWVERQRNLKEGDIVLLSHKPKLGKASYRLARVVAVKCDEAGLARTATLQARPPGGNPGLPYIAKELQTFDMAVQRLVLINPVEDKIPTEADLDGLLH